MSTQFPLETRRFFFFFSEAYLAKAYVILLEVVMMLVVAKSRHTSGNLTCQLKIKEELRIGKGSHQETNGACFASCGIVEYLQKRPSSGHNNSIWAVNWTRNKEQNHEEYEAGEDSNPYTRNHDFWAFHGGIWNLLNH
jgi:hypothetical protein